MWDQQNAASNSLSSQLESQSTISALKFRVLIRLKKKKVVWTSQHNQKSQPESSE